jgi:hypothetical protein
VGPHLTNRANFCVGALREVEHLYQGGPEILLHKLMLDAALEETGPQEFEEWYNTFCHFIDLPF